KFRGPTSSHEYNTNEDDKYLEMVELYRQSNDNLMRLSEAHQIVLAEHAAQQKYISMLESKMAFMESLLQGIEDASPYEPILSRIAFSQNRTGTYPNTAQQNGDTGLRCEMDAAYRYATLPITHQIPKTHMVH